MLSIFETTTPNRYIIVNYKFLIIIASDLISYIKFRIRKHKIVSNNRFAPNPQHEVIAIHKMENFYISKLCAAVYDSCERLRLIFCQIIPSRQVLNKTY